MRTEDYSSCGPSRILHPYPVSRHFPHRPEDKKLRGHPQFVQPPGECISTFDKGDSQIIGRSLEALRSKGCEPVEFLDHVPLQGFEQAKGAQRGLYELICHSTDRFKPEESIEQDQGRCLVKEFNGGPAMMAAGHFLLLFFAFLELILGFFFLRGLLAASAS